MHPPVTRQPWWQVFGGRGEQGMKEQTAPPRARTGRHWHVLLLGLLWLGWSVVHATTPMNGAWREVRSDDTPQRVLDEYQANRLKSFDPAMLQTFPGSPLGNWVVLAQQSASHDGERMLTIYPPTLGKITVHGDGQPYTLALEDFSDTIHGHGRLAWQVPDSLPAAAPILLKFEPSPMLSAPVSFQLQSMSAYRSQDVQWLIFASTCFAVMLAMVLMALCFALLLRDIVYAWYAAYTLCYVLVQGIQTGFVFHPLEWSWLSGITLPVGLTAVALSVAFASLFTIRFCELRRHAPLLRIPITALATGMFLLVLMRCTGVPLLVTVAQTLINPLLMIGAGLLLVAAITTAMRGSRHAWYFLAGWTPLLLLTTLCSAQLGGALPQWSWLNDASVAAGAFEAAVLSLGLADRALRLSRDHDIVRVLADHDALTDVFNRRAWSERATAMMADQPARPIALLFMDLDYFKVLNDNMGHNAGDRALVSVAKALATELRPADLFGRYGGEEFVAMLGGTQAQQAMQVATRLCRRVHRLEIPVSHDASLSISIGVAIARGGDSLESLLERADRAMYDAKLHGRNRACLQADAATPARPPQLHLIRKRSTSSGE